MYVSCDAFEYKERADWGIERSRGGGGLPPAWWGCRGWQSRSHRRPARRPRPRLNSGHFECLGIIVFVTVEWGMRHSDMAKPRVDKRRGNVGIIFVFWRIKNIPKSARKPKFPVTAYLWSKKREGGGRPGEEFRRWGVSVRVT